MPDALSVAVEKSSRLMAEDLCREAGFMLPQSENAKALLESLRDYPGIPSDVLEELLQTIPFQKIVEKQKPERWKCSVCGYIHEGPMPADFRCPICRQGADKFIKT